MQRFLRSFVYAWRGITVTWREEVNFRVQSLCGIAVLAGAFALGFSGLEIACLVIAIALVLAGEIINTFGEDLMNFLKPTHDPVVGKLKDLLAAVVLVHSAAAAVIGLLVVSYHFGY